MNTAEPRQRVPRVAWNDASVTGHLARGEPIVLVGGCPLIAAVVGRWSFDSLSAAFGERDCSVHVSHGNIKLVFYEISLALSKKVTESGELS